MKRFLVALSILLLGACTHSIEPCGKVVCVEEKAGGYTSSKYEYKVTIKDMDWCSAVHEIILFTNDEYKIGDTITFIKK